MEKEMIDLIVNINKKNLDAYDLIVGGKSYAKEEKNDIYALGEHRSMFADKPQRVIDKIWTFL